MGAEILTTRRRSDTLPRALECADDGALYVVGGGAGLPVTIADGADVAQGATTDAESAAGNGTVIALLKRLRTLLGGPFVISGAVTIADGADVAEGATADAAVITDAAGTLSGKLRGLVKWAFERMPAALGQGTMAQSLPVVIASNQSNVPVDVPTATPTVYNVTLTNSDTEYSQALPANCRGFEFQCRTENEVRFAFVTGKVAAPTAPYMTLKAGDYYYTLQINQGGSPSTLYLASSTAGVVAEVIAWV